MTNQRISRTQRRMEKKQTFMILTLLLIGCLVSFSLGVMVGRPGDDVIVEEQMAQQAPAAAVADVVEEVPSPTAFAEEGAIDTELTFYDTLPKGQDNNALGSGINLPPEEKKAKEPATAKTSTPPIKESVPIPVPVAIKEPQPPASGPMTAVRQPEPAATGDFLIQVASVKDRQGALDLRSLLISKGYAAFVESADLGDKGVWHRVYAGPFSKEEAEKRVAALKNDRIASSPFLKRR